MKKNFFVFAAIAAAFALCSCEKNEAPTGTSEPAPGKEPVVELSLGSEVGMKAFGSGVTEVWEKQVNAATFLVFSSSGNIVFRRDLTPTEISTIATTPISLVVPGSAATESYDFVVVANRVIPASVVTKSLLSAELETDGASYNGTFAEVTTKAKRTGGFTMSGLKTQTIASSGSTAVAIVLKRVVSKVEVTAQTTAAFAAKYGNATITISKISLSKTSAQAPLLDTGTVGSGSATYEQASSANKNLFYIFDKAAAAAGARVLLTLDAVYDADGNTTTTADRQNISYEVEMTGKTGGQILRNGAYLVNVNIDGVLGSNVTATVTVAAWETLVTQEISVGK